MRIYLSVCVCVYIYVRMRINLEIALINSQLVVNSENLRTQVSKDLLLKKIKPTRSATLTKYR